MPLDAFPPGTDARAVVDAMVAARLLVASSDGATATVRVAHEALISRWKRAADQLEADRRDLETRALVERQFARWRQAPSSARPLLLLRDPDLANALDLERRWGDELGPELRGFVAQSHQRSRRRHQLAAAAAVVFAIIALAATGFGALAYRAQQTRQFRARPRGHGRGHGGQAARRSRARRNAALIAQSRYLSKEADEAVKAGATRVAIGLVRAALPDSANGTRPAAGA